MTNFEKGTKIIDKKGNQFLVSKIEKDIISIYPRGGGWVKSIPLIEFSKYFKVVQEFENNFIEQITSLNDFLDHNEVYKCRANTFFRWNGWAVPFFDRNTVFQILKDQGYRVTRHLENDELLAEDSNGEEVFIGKSVNGYTFEGWTWELGCDHPIDVETWNTMKNKNEEFKQYFIFKQ